MYTKILNKVVEFSTIDFLTYKKTINEKESCMNKIYFRHYRKNCTFNSCAPIIIKRKERSPPKKGGAENILDKEPYFRQTSMQTKQTRQKAQEKKRRKLNNGFIDLRHVDFIRKAECIKMGCDI